MNKAFREICQTGNFLIEGDVRPESISRLRKKDGKLYAVQGNREYLLRSMDDFADRVIRNFSDYPDEENESIYECTEMNDHLVVMLYVFSAVRRIELESETMYFYLDRLVENDLERQGIILNGDETGFLEKEFVRNSSVFTVEYQGGGGIRTFQMYGGEWRADVEKERPGVYRLKRLVRYRTCNRADSMVQIYRYVKFISFDEAIRTKGYDSPETAIKTNGIFKAWEEYTKFERKIFDDDTAALGFVRYGSYRTEGDEIVFECGRPLQDEALFSDRIESADREYDIVFSDVRNTFSGMEQIMEERERSQSSVIRLGRTLNESFETNTLRFRMPEISFPVPGSGYIILSDRGIRLQERRRRSVMRVLESRSNTTSNMIMRLSAGEEDAQTGSRIEPVTSEVLGSMFGRTDVNLKENFRNAMYIAVNTPDIALIQGPPGTGKTTLINGIVARLRTMGNRNFRILVSSEQHEALYNVIDRLSGSSFPPFVTSGRYSDGEDDEGERRMRDNIEGFQKKLLALCDDILEECGRKDRFSDNLTRIMFDIRAVADKGYARDEIAERLESITQTAMAMGIWKDVRETVEKIGMKLRAQAVPAEDACEGMEFIKRKLRSQRTDRNAFYGDDGLYQLKEMQRVIARYGYDYLKIDADLLAALEDKEDEETFRGYLSYVERVRRDIEPQHDDFELSVTSYRELFDSLSKKIEEAAKGHKRDFCDIVEGLKFKASDSDNIREAVMKYTSVIGSTCAQADRSGDLIGLKGGRYDYVIIDEAARANPLDLMLPVMMGTKVIMVGDQMQLPHYIENNYVRKFSREKGKYTGFDENLLTKSLFQVLYESLEKSWKEGKLKFRRHIRIEEQHRMHPVIGDFISREFYAAADAEDGGETEQGGIRNGPGTKYNVNDFHVFGGKNIVWADVPVTEGMEERESSRISRPAEAEKVIEIVQEIVRKNPEREMRIGVLSFYKRQTERIDGMLKDRFPETVLKNVGCGTVDSFQGREFDIVILSAVRCNREPDIDRCLGFIYYSKSRINVALSRARRLLVVVGDRETMGRSDVFRDYIEYAEKYGEIR